MIRNLTLFVLTISISITAQASNFEYKEVDKFETLNEYANTGEFEKSYKPYIQDCLDNSGGGTGGIRCLIDYEIWDRELNIYYNKLYNMVNEEGKEILKASQLAWLRERDLSIEFNSHILDQEYEGKVGTLHLLMRSDDANEAIAPIVKQRALVLKNWYERAKSLLN